MASDCGSEKRRLHIVLSLDNPLQRETWELLSQAKNKTGAVCEAVCGYHRRKSLEDTLRSLLREELKHVSVPAAPQTVEKNAETGAPIDAAVLDFLRSLEEE